MAGVFELNKFSDPLKSTRTKTLIARRTATLHTLHTRTHARTSALSVLSTFLQQFYGHWGFGTRKYRGAWNQMTTVGFKTVKTVHNISVKVSHRISWIEMQSHRSLYLHSKVEMRRKAVGSHP